MKNKIITDIRKFAHFQYAMQATCYWKSCCPSQSLVAQGNLIQRSDELWGWILLFYNLCFIIVCFDFFIVYLKSSIIRQTAVMHHDFLDQCSRDTYQRYPGYFQEPHWISMGLPEISRVTLTDIETHLHCLPAGSMSLPLWFVQLPWDLLCYLPTAGGHVLLRSFRYQKSVVLRCYPAPMAHLRAVYQITNILQLGQQGREELKGCRGSAEFNWPCSLL